MLFLWDGGSSLSPSSTQPGEDGCFDLLLTVSEQADSGEHELTARQGSLDRLPGREPPRGEDTRAASTPFHVLEIDGELEEGLLERERKTSFLQPRLYPRSEFPADALPRARDQAGRLRPVHQAKELVSIGPVEVSRRGPVVPVDATALSAWGSFGPAPLCMDSPARGKCAFAGSPYSGRVTAIAPHPGDAATIFIGTEGGGVWRTRNGGTSWTPLFDQQPTMRIGAVAVDPFEPDRVFAGTGTDEYGAYGGLGLYVSEDGGAHWTKLGGKTLDGCSIGRIWVQTRGLILLAASVQQYAYENPPTASCEGGVYASDDGGQTWKRWLERPRVEDILVAGNKAFAGVRGEGVYLASILQSAKPGKVLLDPNWAQLGGGLPSSEVGAVRLAAAPSDASRLYVVTGDPKLGLKGGWTSGNGGLSWTPINLPHAGSMFLSLAVSPQSASELYLGANPALYRSLDGGQTYSDKEASRDHLHDDVPALAFDAANRLLIGTDGGIYRTADFQQFENLNTNLSTVLVHPGISGRLTGGGPLLAGIQDGGTAKYTGSKIWLDFGHGGDGWNSAVDPRSTDVLYHTTLVELGIYKSTDGGENSSFLWHPDWQDERRHTLVMDLERPDRLYGGTCKRLWRSDDGAENWTAISPALPGCPAVQAPAPAASDADVVYFGMGSGGVMVTRDGGAQWTDTFGNGLPNRYVTDIAVNPERAEEAWATVSGFGSGHVFHTDDYGGHWKDISGNLPDAPVQAVAVDERRMPPTVFVGTDVGVFVSFDNGTHWAKTGGGLPNALVTDLLMDRAAVPYALIAATYGRGVWAAAVDTAQLKAPPQVAEQWKQDWLKYAETFSTSPPSWTPGP